MARTLAWIAAGGIGAGVVFLSLAYATGGRDVDRLLDRALHARSCGTTGGKAAAERRLAWTGGDTIDIAVSAITHYRGGEGSEVVLRGPADAIDHVEVNGGRISLDCRDFSDRRSVEITLPGRRFRRVNLDGAGDLVMSNVNQPELIINIRGSGDVRAQGTADRVTIKVAGSGTAWMADLAMKQLAVEIAGSGNVEAAPKDEADVRIAGSGNVRLLSRPKELRSKIAGSGRVSQVPPDPADKQEGR